MKIRTDFVTNSSSSSFVACGVWSQELADFVTELLGGKKQAYAQYQVGSLNVLGDIVSVTTTLDYGNFHIYSQMIDDYDERTSEQKKEDDEQANTPSCIASALSAFLPTMTQEQKVRFLKLITDAATEQKTSAQVYVDQTDGFDLRSFYHWDFNARSNGTKLHRESGHVFYEEGISFVLPDGFDFERETDENGDESDCIRNGFSVDKNWNLVSEYAGFLSTVELEDEEKSANLPMDQLIRKILDDNNRASLVLNTKPTVAFTAVPEKMHIFGNEMKMITLIMFAEIAKDQLLTIEWRRAFTEEEEILPLMETAVSVANAIRIHGEPIRTSGLTSNRLMREVMPNYDEVETVNMKLSVETDENGDISIGFEADDPDEPIPSSAKGKKKVSNRSAITENQELTCTKVKKSDCRINMGVLEKYNGSENEIILPSGIEGIGSDAFSCNKTLRIVVIPEGVREIGNNAFRFCEALEQVFLPSTLEKIEDNAFWNCESLTEIIIPDGVRSIGKFAFMDCKNLKDIYAPPSAFSIELGAFYTFNDDTVIHTPQWSSAETYAEENDMKFDHRQAPVRAIPKAKKNTSQTKAAASKATATSGNLEDFVVEDGVLKEYKGSAEHLLLPEGIHTVGEKAFKFNTTLKSVVIPEGVHTIAKEAFDLCSNLESVTLPSTLKYLGCFGYAKMKKLQIPNGVEVIGYRAFNGCNELKEIILPPSVTTIEDMAFAACGKAKNIYVPESVTSIGGMACWHSGRTVLHVHPGSYAEEFAKGHKVKFDNEVESYLEELEKAKKGPAKKKTTSKVVKAETEETVETTHIAPAPEYNQVEKRVKLEDDGWSIAVPDDFEYSNDESKNGESAKNPRGKYELIIARPKSKHFVNFDEPYSNQTSFVTLERTDHLTALNWYRSFDSWVTLKNDPGLTIKYMPMMSNMHVVNYIVMIETDKSARRCQFVMAGKQKKEEKLRFVEDMLSTVRLIGNENEENVAQSRKEKKTTTKNSVPQNTETVLDSVPQKPLESLQLRDEGKTLWKFNGKDTAVVVPDGVTEISSFAFSDTKVTAVTLPDSVKKIGKYAFTDCSKLVQINIPASVTSVGERAFNQCSSLTEIVWPGSVKTIPANACWHCDALAKVVIEEGITEIGDSAFSFCPKLKDLHLPQSINKIGDHALLMSGSPTLHVYLDSYAEKYAKENNLPTVILLTPEQEAEKKRQEEAHRIAEEKYAAELKAWEQKCGEIRALREQRLAELLDEKRAALKSEAQSNYDAAVAAANKRKEAAQQKKSDAEMRLSALGIFKFAEKKAAKTAIEEATGEIQAAETALVTAKQTFDKDLASIPATINSHRYMVTRQVEQVYPLPAKPQK